MRSEGGRQASILAASRPARARPSLCSHIQPRAAERLVMARRPRRRRIRAALDMSPEPT
ncbi:hypothetical protein G6O69_04560 [Pseudenhygromyxa sp. WMMC2535]|uniref:hypothetical protein n=1 Tax=Pseudenhygromyxa sp. WMMC2535 TaxID=2712867 RepID=UPI0015960A49|nr:hypothetical protein [Pseudenhygromyxa sp. WMMC2535]NVB37090.1 hypothetical protein [Pseudenhygromyxa sp. WMMC2535]